MAVVSPPSRLVAVTAGLPRRVRALSREHRWQIVGVLWVLTGALLLRLYKLGTVPANLTADETDFFRNVFAIRSTRPLPWFGFDWTGSPALAGAHLMALTTRVFGLSIAGFRMYAVILSMLTLLVFFLIARTRLSYWPSLAATAMLATNLWFLHFSRTNWTNINSALAAVLAAYFLTLALDTGRWGWFAAAGAAAAFGLYGYFAGRAVPFAIAATFPLALWQYRQHWRRVLLGYVLCGVTCVVLFAPQIEPILDNYTYFNQRVQNVSITNHEGELYGADTLPEKIWVQVRRNAQGFLLVSSDPEIMTVGLWGRYLPPGWGLLDPLTRAVYWLGLVMAVVRFRRVYLWWAFLFVPLLPLQVMTIGTPDAARGLITAPFMYLFVALGLQALVDGIARLAGEQGRARATIAAPLLLAVLVVITSVTNVRGYWNWIHTPGALLLRLPGITQEEFPEWRALHLAAGREGRWGFDEVAWRRQREELQAREAATRGGGQSEAGSAASGSAATTKDQQRVADLKAIADGLTAYKRKHGLFPQTNDWVQTLCAHPPDQGCKLKETMRQLPLDPGNGDYWYRSDGVHFFVYAALEQPGTVQLCRDRPDHLANIQNLYCVEGP